MQDRSADGPFAVILFPERHHVQDTWQSENVHQTAQRSGEPIHREA